MQRAYDQIVHDVCIQSLPVTFCIDRAGLVGADGETHQGILDLSYMNTIPNMAVFAPKNKYEFYDVLRFSEHFDGPLAIRYPRGEAYEGLKEFRAPIVPGKSEVLLKGSGIAVIAVGSMVETAMDAGKLLEEEGICATVVNARFVKPLDTQLLSQLSSSHRLVVTMEENVLKRRLRTECGGVLCGMLREYAKGASCGNTRYICGAWKCCSAEKGTVAGLVRR